MRLFLLLSMMCLMWNVPAHAKNQGEKRIIVGYVEKITVPRVGAQFNSKLDTGAETSSIHASIVEMEEKGDDGYVIFTIDTEEGKSNHVKKSIQRMVNIKKKDGGLQRRPVVDMTFCIAGGLVKGEVNLSDREHFNYDVLVGRNMLEKGQFIVDVSKTYTAPPNCPKPKTNSEKG